MPEDDKYQPKTINQENEHGAPNNHGVSDEELRRYRDDLGEQLLQAEDVAALKEGRMPTSAAMQEKDPGKIDLGDARSLYDQSDKNRQERTQRNRRGKEKKGPRGIFIGVMAGGGITSVIAGLAFMLPLKLPGIMNTLIDDAGKRLEHVAERRAEKVFIRYIMRGSAAAARNGNVIATGNPIGDLFANMRASKFEDNLLKTRGLSFEPGPGKTVRLIHNGEVLLDAEKDADIIKLLEKDGSLSKKDLRLIVRDQIPAWRFLKRAKFVNWLRLKYDIPRFGVREREPDEKLEDYQKSVDADRAELSIREDIKNVDRALNCDDIENCALDKDGEGSSSKSARDIGDAAEQELKASVKDLAGKTGDKLVEGLVKRLLTKIGLSSAIGSIPVVGTAFAVMQASSVFYHYSNETVNKDFLQKLHATAIKASTAVLGVGYAGIASQTMAGDLDASTTGMFASRFDGWETSVAYNFIDSGRAIGERLDGMETIAETVTLPAFASILKGTFNTITFLGGPSLEAWYDYVYKPLNALGDKVGDALSWVIKFTPAQALMDKITPYMASMMEGLFKMMGMFIDPFAIGAKLAMYIHEGFLGAFNDYAKETGERKLTATQAIVMDQEINQDHLAYLQGESLFDRVFNVANQDSLAANLAQTIPSYTQTNPLLAVASFGTKTVSSAPANIAKVSTGTAYAAEPLTSEQLYNGNMYGGLPTDLDADLDPNISRSEPQPCPENNDNAFNHCTVDRTIVDSMSCVFVKCADMKLSDAAGDRLFAADTEPLYGPDAPAKAPAPTFAWESLLQPVSMVASLLPLTALELSRRGGKV